MDQRTRDAVANENSGTGLTTFEYLCPCCHRKSTLIETRAMAVEAVLLEKWLDVGSEIHVAICSRGKMWRNFHRIVMRTYSFLCEHMRVDRNPNQCATEVSAAFLPTLSTNLDRPSIGNGPRVVLRTVGLFAIDKQNVFTRNAVGPDQMMVPPIIETWR